MFDFVEIEVRSGKGGDGAISFRREKYVPFGGPDGGDGGNGGNVVIRADQAVENLLNYKCKRFFRAADGGNGRGQKKHGRNGADLILTVPAGTVISNKLAVSNDALIADLAQPGQEVIAARGGKGGGSNVHFASSTNQAPQIAQRGEAGETISLVLEMRLIADIGIIGYPNVGKSTLLAAASAAKPKIASYPFTTIEPILGVVEVGQQSFVLAEIPGLLEGAHLGHGLGHDFLRHMARTRVLIHMVDASSASPIEDMMQVNAELNLFDSALIQKPQLVAVNKIDLPEAQTRLAEIRKAFAEAGIKVYLISAATGKGVTKLMEAAMGVLNKAAQKEVSEISRKIFRPQPKGRAAIVHKERDVFVVAVPELERLKTRDGVADAEIRSQLRRQLVRTGVAKALEKAGIRPGDRVRCGDLEWEW